MTNHINPLFRQILNSFMPPTTTKTDCQKIAAFALKFADKDRPEPIPSSQTDMSAETMQRVTKALINKQTNNN